MLMLLDSLVFVAAAGVSGYAIFATIRPNLAKIRNALAGGTPQLTPFEKMVRAERRIAVRRWAAEPRAAAVRFREAA
jgi:hypothetical protein